MLAPRRVGAPRRAAVAGGEYVQYYTVGRTQHPCRRVAVSVEVRSRLSSTLSLRPIYMRAVGMRAGQKVRKYTPPLQSRYDSGARSGLLNYVIRLRNSECGIVPTLLPTLCRLKSSSVI